MTTLSCINGKLVVQMEGIQGPPGPAGASGDSVIGAPHVSPVFLTDTVVLIRNNVVCTASIADFLAATSGPTTGGAFNFSIAGNSGLAAGAM